ALTSSSTTTRLPRAWRARASTEERRDEGQEAREEKRARRQAETSAVPAHTAQNVEDHADAEGPEAAARRPARRRHVPQLAAIGQMAEGQRIRDLPPVYPPISP